MPLSNPVSATIKMDALKSCMPVLNLRHFWKPPVLRRFVVHSAPWKSFRFLSYRGLPLSHTTSEQPTLHNCTQPLCSKRISHVPYTKLNCRSLWIRRNPLQYICRRWPWAAEWHKQLAFKQGNSIAMFNCMNKAVTQGLLFWMYCCTKWPCMLWTSPSLPQSQVPDDPLSRHAHIFMRTWASMQTGIWLKIFLSERPLHQKRSPGQGLCSSTIWGFVCIKRT